MTQVDVYGLHHYRNFHGESHEYPGEIIKFSMRLHSIYKTLIKLHSYFIYIRQHRTRKILLFHDLRKTQMENHWDMCQSILYEYPAFLHPDIALALAWLVLVQMKNQSLPCSSSSSILSCDFYLYTFSAYAYL